MMTSTTALRIGAGASVLAFPKSSRALIQKKLREVVVHSYNDNGNGYLSVPDIGELSDKIKLLHLVRVLGGIGKLRLLSISFLKKDYSINA